MTRIAFFGHNLNEPAVRKRAGAFMQAGCEVIGIMPHRGAAKEAEFQWISLGETRDNDYAGRLRPLLKSFALSHQSHPELGAVDLIYARNLDMLACAHAFARRNRLEVLIIYECLDIHTKLIGDGKASRLLRRVEGALINRSDMLVYSSPRFESAYFAQRHPGLYRGRLLENRLLAEDAQPRPDQAKQPHAPLRIGWVGNLRCRRSFDLLAMVGKTFGDRVDIRLHGYPAPGVFPNFEADIVGAERTTYFGRYDGAQDLPRIYEDLDVVWAADWYEAGHNSVWLLPNRIYEGGYYATPALAPSGTETGAWVKRNQAGWCFDDPPEATVPELVQHLLDHPEAITRKSEALLALPDSIYLETVADTQAFVAEMLAARKP